MECINHQISLYDKPYFDFLELYWWIMVSSSLFFGDEEPQCIESHEITAWDNQTSWIKSYPIVWTSSLYSDIHAMMSHPIWVEFNPLLCVFWKGSILGHKWRKPMEEYVKYGTLLKRTHSFFGYVSVFFLWWTSRRRHRDKQHDIGVWLILKQLMFGTKYSLEHWTQYWL